jgi:hypothetical protein
MLCALLAVPITAVFGTPANAEARKAKVVVEVPASPDKV